MDPSATLPPATDNFTPVCPSTPVRSAGPFAGTVGGPARGGRNVDWFERLTGFAESDYRSTRERLTVDDGHLLSRVNGRRYGIGELETPSLAELRERARSSVAPRGRLRLRNVVGDVGRMHGAPEHAGALFQVASQFNLLEMTSPQVTPEDGVSRYQFDRTQGPACAIAAGAGTIWRNYFAPVGGGEGQTAGRQLDMLVDVGQALSHSLGRRPEDLWAMRNGYALCTTDGLAAIETQLAGLGEAGCDALRARLRIGLHWQVAVTDGPAGAIASQAYCSALPVAYSGIPAWKWQRFATLVLEAAYEATLLAACLNAAAGRSNIVLLTRLGGGAFGNDPAWIDAAMRRALDACRDVDLDVRLVSFAGVDPQARALEAAYE